MNVEETVKSRFATIVGLPVQQIDFDADLRNEYGIDSVKALKLISEVEVEFDVDIEQDEARSVQTLNDLIGMINAKLTPPTGQSAGSR